MPDLDWYKLQSKIAKQAVRCPFASEKICPRYFRTRWLFGSHAVLDRMPPKDVEECESDLAKSPLFSRDFQPQPELLLNKLGAKSFGHCCPELVFEAYGVFAESVRFFEDENDRRSCHAELKSNKIHTEDWRLVFAHLSPRHFTECKEFSILNNVSKSTKQRGSKTQARDNISQKDRWEVFERDKFICKYCGRKPPEVALVIDHVISVDAGGTNDKQNLVTACQECNSGKSNRPPPNI